MLLAGAAHHDITPAVPVDLMGYVRRWQPAEEVLEPLLATALVLDSDGDRLVLLAADAVMVTQEYAARVRGLVAEQLDTTVDRVLLNVSHTHAAPFAGGGAYKLGGDMRNIKDSETAYDESLPFALASAAVRAVQRMEPARLGSGTGRLAGLAVNRRERTEDGRTILGWNPAGPVDDSVGVLRVDRRRGGSPLAIVVNFGCHPVVVGPEHSAVGPDFPGPMRRTVEKFHPNATCLFLQGAGGNILPLEAFHDAAGPEEAFGRRLAIRALDIAEGVDTAEMRIERLDYGSVTPISRYRRVAVDSGRTHLSAAVGDVELPLKSVPDEAALEDARAKYEADLRDAESAGFPREELNPLLYHLLWAEEALRQLREDGPYDHVVANLQAFRLGETALAAVPGEVFSEISLAVKERADFPHTLFAGYTNGVISYLPCKAEYPHGGYEVDYAHHSFGLLEQVDDSTEKRLVDGCLELLQRLRDEG